MARCDGSGLRDGGVLRSGQRVGTKRERQYGERQYGERQYSKRQYSKRQYSKRQYGKRQYGNGSAHAPLLATEIGHSTRGWLDLQRSGAAAAPALSMLGEEAGLAYQRHMDSFRTKVPASFGSSLSGNGNLLHVDYTNVGGASQN
ncbi:DUF3613 domain-containing protein [Paraburkholderia diazotrophica]|uniref:Uncharacterized protein n=1 Tax=Paraburkholderia diazotrophica TaxID=667676 RepID=A0A1H6QKY8_9BURK|nr:DUF3613 domain-containing protein [Paraburkholderia diazotrophica]SEI40130.1 Protein of unknown function [Paraburkholderia diazotrophica]